MNAVLPLVLGALMALAAPLGAAETDLIRPAGEATLEEFRWHARPIVVFADTPEDPRFDQQIARLREGLDALAERDVVILTDTDPAARAPLRLKLRPRGFMLVLIAKDGTVALRKPAPWTVRELSRSIDKMPLRQREIIERRSTP